MECVYGQKSGGYNSEGSGMSFRHVTMSVSPCMEHYLLTLISALSYTWMLHIIIWHQSPHVLFRESNITLQGIA